MTNKEGKKRKEGEIFERSNGEGGVEIRKRRRRNSSRSVVRQWGSRVGDEQRICKKV